MFETVHVLFADTESDWITFSAFLRYFDMEGSDPAAKSEAWRRVLNLIFYRKLWAYMW